MPADLRVIRPADRVLDAASGGMRREAAVSRALVGAERLWVGYVELHPFDISAAHHHGEAESVIYVISGRARFVVDGAAHEAGAGDFVWVPPQVVHVEANLGNEPVRMVVARSTQDTLVFNVEMPPGWAAIAAG
ncbi:MAG: cupin domain-containing protein [Candidatus Limnocylindria bacterium]